MYSERIKLNLSYNYILNFSDIDKYQENGASDNISMVDFTICYDFFTKFQERSQSMIAFILMLILKNLI
ncbi:MAG: hypothetical protein CM15mP112_04280 [Flavobacteriales bacterium]|nr:MAG: hypothetical protein CM15mP112_04280 [Flavobacteriales bacterium]